MTGEDCVATAVRLQKAIMNGLALRPCRHAWAIIAGTMIRIFWAFRSISSSETPAGIHEQSTGDRDNEDEDGKVDEDDEEEEEDDDDEVWRRKMMKKKEAEKGKKKRRRRTKRKKKRKSGGSRC
jgi:hypothetical protein